MPVLMVVNREGGSQGFSGAFGYFMSFLVGNRKFYLDMDLLCAKKAKARKTNHRMVKGSREFFSIASDFLSPSGMANKHLDFD
jgi:hypothetical protein